MGSRSKMVRERDTGTYHGGHRSIVSKLFAKPRKRRLSKLERRIARATSRETFTRALEKQFAKNRKESSRG